MPSRSRPPAPSRPLALGRSGALSLALAGILLLGACSARPIHPEAAGIEKVNQVEWKVHRHAVRFGLGTAEPRPGELEKLADFLAPYDETAGAYLFIDPAREMAGRELSRRRMQRLRPVVVSRGFTPRLLPTDPAGVPATASDPRVATVYVGEYVVIPPDCPDMRKQTAADFTNTQTSNFGCATVTNLGLMVANPADLVYGRDPGPADAERAVLGMQRYREPPKQKDAGTAIETITTTGGKQ